MDLEEGPDALRADIRETLEKRVLDLIRGPRVFPGEASLPEDTMTEDRRAEDGRALTDRADPSVS
jgi:hypothetical protein